MFIARNTIKLLLVHRKRYLFLAVLTALLCLAAGLLGVFFLRDNVVVDPVRILVVDRDDTLETRVFYSSVSGGRGYQGLVRFEQSDEADARLRLESGEATAMVIIPQGLTDSIKTGENMDVLLVYSRVSPLKAELVRGYAGAFLDMLKTAQAGVYASLEYAGEHGSREQYDALFRSSNLGFMQYVGKRQELFLRRELAATGDSGIFRYYVVHALTFLLLLTPAILTDTLRPAHSPQVLATLGRLGVSPLRVAGETQAGLLLLYGVPALAVDGALCAAGHVSLLTVPVLVPVLLLTCAITHFCMLLFPGSAGAPVICGGALACLFLSGGIIPADYLAAEVLRVGGYTPHYTLARLLLEGSSGRFLWREGAWALVLWLLFSGGSVLLLSRQGKRRDRS